MLTERPTGSKEDTFRILRKRMFSDLVAALCDEFNRPKTDEEIAVAYNNDEEDKPFTMFEAKIIRDYGWSISEYLEYFELWANYRIESIIGETNNANIKTD